MAHRPTAKDLKTKENLQAAATFLRAKGKPDWAESVDYMLSPAGWATLGRLRSEEGPSPEVPNLAIRMSASDVEAIKAAAREAGNTLTADVNEGLALFLDDLSSVRPPFSPQYSPAGVKVNLNVRPDVKLRQRVADTGVKPMHVAANYLLWKYSAGPYAPGYEAPQKPGSPRTLVMPAPVREELKKRLAESGDFRSKVVEEGFAKFLAKEFTPAVPVWPKAVTARATLKVYPRNDLFDEVKAVAKNIAPSQVALAYLLEKYGIDPSTAE